MLSVIGLEFCSASIVDIDALDYLIYGNKPIIFNDDKNNNLLIQQSQIVIERLLTVNHLQRCEVNLVLLVEKDNITIEPSSFIVDDFSSQTITYTLVDALTTSHHLSNSSKQASLIINVNQKQLDGVHGLLVCDKRLMTVKTSQLSYCHVYADIDAADFLPLSEQNATNNIANDKINNITNNISDFIVNQKLKKSEIESLLVGQVTEDSNKKMLTSKIQAMHKNACLTAFEQCDCKTSNTEFSSNEVDKSTLLVCINNLENSSENFTIMHSLFSSVLCLDQHYRLASHVIELEQETGLQERWNKSGFYYLSQATSYLTNIDVSRRNLIFSQLNNNSQQLLLLSKATTQTINNGFLAQQMNKPVIFKATSIVNLQKALKLCLYTLNASENSLISFNIFCQKQNLISENIKQGVYCLVLVARSIKTLVEQINIAVTGIPKAIEDQKTWKTPSGSYFSGQLIEPDELNSNKAISFIYPGVGSLYVGMGRDLLRLFPAVYQSLNTLSDNLAFSLQDKLMTPRLIKPSDSAQHIKNEKLLRSELANIAEAGVSYACLLTNIFQQQLNINATSAAGYSMGEVSMFAALDCWENPQSMSSRLRKSPIFTEQLAGALKRLNTVSNHQFELKDTAKSNAVKWESYHLKTSVAEVQAVLDDFTSVYLTIINTEESLVIAGIPEQCLLLAKKLKVRAVPLRVPNIIHCELAKYEYENMKQLYSLPVNKKTNKKQRCNLYSSSCYLPIPLTEKAVAVSISKCLTEQVNFPRLIKKIASTGENVFMEMGAGKSLSTWIERILKNNKKTVTCLSVDQKNTDDYQAILKTIAPLISLGYPINLASFFNGTLIRPVNKMSL